MWFLIIFSWQTRDPYQVHVLLRIQRKLTFHQIPFYSLSYASPMWEYYENTSQLVPKACSICSCASNSSFSFLSHEVTTSHLGSNYQFLDELPLWFTIPPALAHLWNISSPLSFTLDFSSQAEYWNTSLAGSLPLEETSGFHPIVRVLNILSRTDSSLASLPAILRAWSQVGKPHEQLERESFR